MRCQGCKSQWKGRGAVELEWSSPLALHSTSALFQRIGAEIRKIEKSPQGVHFECVCSPNQR